ncbi:FUSC family protein [Francisella sp. 19X1-34]|uniref:FUSC family protein n=1 Tax=Francisella sp. 19X1-34 TaxID=3087177 RepID=UPI002E33AF2F|nr:FUSC family protein [Francisella sp. 19X1-34]MED7788076.1 FUSC family protein [Francisella sp. 19X1-34]
MISIVTSIIIWEVFKVPGGTLNMIISLITIAGINNSGSLRKGSQRFWGCVIEVCVGMIIMVLSSINIILLLIGYFCFSTFFLYYYFSHKCNQYAGVQAAGALCITCFPSDSMQVVISLGFYRALGIMLGVIIINLVFMLFESLKIL